MLFGIISITLPVAISGGPEGTKLDTAGQIDARDVVVDQEQNNKSVSCAAGFNPSVGNENTATNLPDFYVQAMGTKCVTPYTICDIAVQPINYPCCCPDNTCGYVSQ